MLANIKLLLGSAASQFSDNLLNLLIAQVQHFMMDYCGREFDFDTDLTAIALCEQIVIIRCNKLGSEGAASENFSGVSVSYIDGLPADMIAALNRKRKIKVL